MSNSNLGKACYHSSARYWIVNEQIVAQLRSPGPPRAIPSASA